MSRSRRRSKAVAAPTPKVAAPSPETLAAAALETGWFLSARVTLVLIIVSATVLRLAAAPFGRYFEDSQVLAFRAERLARLPIGELYATNQGVIGHLPGDLWLLWYVSNFYHALAPDGDFYGDTFLYVTKLVPIMADAGAALALYLLGRDLAGKTAGLIAAALYAFNPGPFFVAAIWDQWDSISTCAALFALWFVLRGRVELAAAALTYAVLVKPQFAVLGLIFALVYVRRALLPPLLASRHAGGESAAIRALALPVARGAGAVLAAVVTAIAVLVPFGVGLPPLSTRFDLRDRLEYAFGVHDETTLNAFNLWATPLAGNAVEDFSVRFAGLTARTWGQMLYAAAVLVILALWWRRGTDRALVWACMAMTFASFMLPTRIHERYLLPTVALAALLAAIQPRLLWLWGALTVTYTANLVSVYWMAHDQRGAPFFDRYDPWMMTAALVNVALFLWVFVRGLSVADGDVPAGAWRVPIWRWRPARTKRSPGRRPSAVSR